MNPISRLAQIQQAKKEKEPDYVLLSERGMPRRREFVMQVFLTFIREEFFLTWKKSRNPQVGVEIQGEGRLGIHSAIINGTALPASIPSAWLTHSSIKDMLEQTEEFWRDWVHAGCLAQRVSNRRLVSALLWYSVQPEPVNCWDEETDGIRNKIEKDAWRWNRAKRMNFGFAGKLGRESWLSP